MPDLTISMQTLVTNEVGTLRSIKPDSTGTYRRVPVAVLGATSHNGGSYDPSSTIKAMQAPSLFNLCITQGGLYSELGHPPRDESLTDKDFVLRNMRVDLKKSCCYFTKMDVVPVSGTKKYIIYADIVPAGPLKQFLIDSFADPKRNTCFSLRALCSKVRLPNGMKQPVVLVTFDVVPVDGLEGSSKRGIISTESINENYRAFSKTVHGKLVDQVVIEVPAGTLTEADISNAVGAESAEFGIIMKELGIASSMVPSVESFCNKGSDIVDVLFK